MGFLERRAGRFRRSTDGAAPGRARYGTPPGARNGGSGIPLHHPAHRANTDPVGPPSPRPTGGADLADLLGRTVLEEHTQRICRDHGLLPHGPALSRSYLNRAAGLEIAADTHGLVTTVFLHFNGDDGFAPFHGEIPGGAGTATRRAALWAALGRPDDAGDAYRDRFLGDFGPWDRWLLPICTLHSQYALDGENLHRITLTRPEPARPT
jgi:hypothetical protein